jgi:translation initiation factor IF-1
VYAQKRGGEGTRRRQEEEEEANEEKELVGSKFSVRCHDGVQCVSV